MYNLSFRIERFILMKLMLCVNDRGRKVPKSNASGGTGYAYSVLKSGKPGFVSHIVDIWGARSIRKH